MDLRFDFGAQTELVAFIAAILISGIAALTDWRAGKVPNWLTYPLLVLGPLAYGIAHGSSGAISSVLGIFVCGLVPMLLWFQGAVGGGDVKMIAAIGAVMGPLRGLEVELISLVVAALYALGRLAWEGKLLGTLANSFFLALNPLLPKKHRRKITPTMMATVRMGGAFFAASVLILLSRHPEFYL